MLLLHLDRCLEIVKKIQAESSQRSIRLATAESCTGGLLASVLTHYPGSSHFYQGGLCTYSNDAKIRLLGVPKKTLDEYGAVSEQTAKAMARGALEKFNGNFAISVTGIAGPEGGTPTKPVGMICCGFGHNHTIVARTYRLGKDRLANRSEIVALALGEIYRLITQNEP